MEEKNQYLTKLNHILSESAMIKYMAKVEAALTLTLAQKKICSMKIAKEVETACDKVKAEDVYAEEDRIKHNVRALVNMIQKNVSDKAKPYVHFTTTSHDIICTSDAARYKDFTNKVLLPTLKKFEKTLMKLSLREKKTVQIGRTHGQHAEPITFGFTMAEYVSRFGHAIKNINITGNNVRGKISGAVGAYNASSLFFKNPMEFERSVLRNLGLKPGVHSTQVAEPEYVLDFVHSCTEAFGVIANLSDDMRNLQRSEIAEVGESFGKSQVGSSTMPHKRNPINFENVKSMWKTFMPRMITAYSDQISEHQRDLTNSASSRFIPEMLVALLASVERINKIMENLVVDRVSLKKNFEQNKQLISAEPTYIILAAYGHPDAHEHVRMLTLEAQKTGKDFQELVLKDQSLKKYVDKMTKDQLKTILDPEMYIGAAVKKTEDVIKFWKKELKMK